MTGETKPKDPSVVEDPSSPLATKGELVFVLKYDEELACLVTEGVVRQEMLPSGLR